MAQLSLVSGRKALSRTITEEQCAKAMRDGSVVDRDVVAGEMREARAIVVDRRLFDYRTPNLRIH
jgi:hypothetical protein